MVEGFNFIDLSRLRSWIQGYERLTTWLEEGELKGELILYQTPAPSTRVRLGEWGRPRKTRLVS